MNQNWLVTIFFFALLLLLLYLAVLIVSPFLKAITWAAILAVMVYPAYAWLLKLLRGKATLAALLVTLLITFLVLFPAFRMAGFLSQETIALAKVVRTLADGAEVEMAKDKPWVKDLLKLWDQLSLQFASFGIDLKKVGIQGAQVASGFVVSQAKEIAQDVFIFGVNFVISLFTFFFLLRDGKELCFKLRALLPMDQKHQELLFDNIVSSLYAVIHGCLVTALVQGLLAGIGYWLVGVPFALLLGVATAFTALFPIGGSALVWLPAALYLYLQGTYVQGTILLLWGVGVVGMIDNVLKPLFIGSRLRLPTLFLFFGILGGLSLFGALGLILGPVLLALLAALLDLYLKEYAKA
ncbi:MAG: AI-2E family transporter [Deltaproteobacteria bacterium]|nr:AI-2E family transporter [Deltaproteobacteria bacterium]